MCVCVCVYDVYINTYIHTCTHTHMYTHTSACDAYMCVFKFAYSEHVHILWFADTLWTTTRALKRATQAGKQLSRTHAHT